MQTVTEKIVAVLFACLFEHGARRPGRSHRPRLGARYQDLQPGSGGVPHPGDLVTVPLHRLAG